MRMGVIRVYVVLTLGALGLLWVPQTASAQYRPAAAAPTAGIAEDYHIEASYGWWNATPELIVNSESLGILGTDVDLVSDLGIEKHRLGKSRYLPGTNGSPRPAGRRRHAQAARARDLRDP